MPSLDIVVVGASAGGVEALKQLASGLPAGLSAAVFVVLHSWPRGTSYLPEILSSAGPLPAAHPRDGEAVEHGRIYVAPPDHHMLLEPGRVRLNKGPRENRTRPMVDPLFRSASLRRRFAGDHRAEQNPVACIRSEPPGVTGEISGTYSRVRAY